MSVPSPNLLHARWALWFHSLNNDNWDHDSYAILDIIDSTTSFAATRRSIRNISTISASRPSRGPKDLVNGAMLFWMRERTTLSGSRFLYPSWEDSGNAEGGVACFVCEANTATDLFWYLSSCAAGETLFQDARDGVLLVNGVSLCPRGGINSVVKIWLGDCSRLILIAGKTRNISDDPVGRARVIVDRLSTHARARLSGIKKSYHILHRTSQKKDDLQTTIRHRELKHRTRPKKKHSLYARRRYNNRYPK